MQTMLTVVTQNSRLLRRSAFSGDRIAIGFGYPRRLVPDARCQVMPLLSMYNISRVGDLFCRVQVAFVSKDEQKQHRNRSAQRSEVGAAVCAVWPAPAHRGRRRRHL